MATEPYQPDPIEETARTTTTNLNYLLPNGPSINRRFVSAGVEVNTGKYGLYPTTIRDGRSIRHHFTFNKHGFQLLDAPTCISDFHDKTEVESKYQAEVCAHVKAAFNADLVVSRGWMLRTSGTIPDKSSSPVKSKKESYRHYGGLQPAAGEVHVDTDPARQLVYAERAYKAARPDGPGFKRFIISSFWRTFSPPPQNCPLAVCDAQSVGDDEGVTNVLWVVDKIPETEAERLDPKMDDENQLAAAIFLHNPNHRWWYFSRMEKDEALLFKFHDSDRSVGWRVPHSAFWDDSFGDEANVRSSIECRTIAFWE
ncbi:putative ga4 desaturase family protein [Rhypophila decipiens]